MFPEWICHLMGMSNPQVEPDTQLRGCGLREGRNSGSCVALSDWRRVGPNELDPNSPGMVNLGGTGSQENWPKHDVSPRPHMSTAHIGKEHSSRPKLFGYLFDPHSFQGFAPYQSNNLGMRQRSRAKFGPRRQNMEGICRSVLVLFVVVRGLQVPGVSIQV